MNPIPIGDAFASYKGRFFSPSNMEFFKSTLHGLAYPYQGGYLFVTTEAHPTDNTILDALCTKGLYLSKLGAPCFDRVSNTNRRATVHFWQGGDDVTITPLPKNGFGKFATPYEAQEYIEELLKETP